jgi:hypothetical protein
MKSLDQSQRVVLAFADGRRLKGLTYNFSPMRDSLTLFLKDTNESVECALRDLKAIFFVRDFEGTPGEVPQEPEQLPQGRPIEVTFKDGEKIRGATNAYNPQKLGFFIQPAQPNSNNLRIFVIRTQTAEVKLG